MVKNTFDPPVRTSEEKAFTRRRITHELKIYSDFFYAVCTGVKRAELRKNDRDYQVGDILHLIETPRDNCHSTGEYINATITHIADISEWIPGYVLLSIELESVGAEAVAWLHADNGIGIPAITRSRNVANSWLSKGWNVQPLYATPQPVLVVPDEVLICDICGHDAWHKGGRTYECTEGHIFEVRAQIVEKAGAQ